MLNQKKILTELKALKEIHLQAAEKATTLIGMLQGEENASPRIRKKHRSIGQAAVTKRNLQISKKVA